MIFLLLAIVLSTAIVISFKLFGRYRIDNVQAITFNYAIAAILGFVLYPKPYTFAELPSNEWFPWALGIGVTFIVVFFLFALSAQKAGVAITAVLSKMSVIIPVSVGIFLYHDNINALKIFGILAAIIAFYLTFKQKGGEKVSKKYLLLPLLLFLGNGTNDTLTKHSQMNYVGDEQFLFISTIFSMSLLIGLCIMAYYIIFKGMKITGRSIVAGLILGVLNFGSSYFFLLGLYEFESAVFFPIFNVSIVSLSALSGLLFFGEKLRPINWLGICIAVSAILLIYIA